MLTETYYHKEDLTIDDLNRVFDNNLDRNKQAYEFLKEDNRSNEINFIKTMTEKIIIKKISQGIQKNSKNKEKIQSYFFINGKLHNFDIDSLKMRVIDNMVNVKDEGFSNNIKNNKELEDVISSNSLIYGIM